MGTGDLLGKPNKLWGSDLRWTSILSRGSRNTPSRFMLRKPGYWKYEPVWLIGLHFFFLNYFVLALFISLIKFSKIVFVVWNFVRSLKFYYKNNFCPSLHAFKTNWIRLFYFKLNNRKWENLLCVFQRNYPKYSNDQTEIDSNFTVTETLYYAPLQRQATNDQTNFHNLKTHIQLNLLTVTFLTILTHWRRCCP